MAILETINVCANRTVKVRWQYLKPLKCVKIELLVFDNNTLTNVMVG